MRRLTRRATLAEVPRLLGLRQQSILGLAPRGMSISQSETWAASLTIQGMEKRFREAEIWIAELNHAMVGWIALRVDYIDGLYVDPQFAEQGIGTALLSLVEMSMRERGIQNARLESSVNAERFYLRRGYERTGGHRPGDAIPMVKRL